MNLNSFIKQLGKELGFDQIGITDINLNQEATYLKKWLQFGFHGNMSYLERNIELREHPEQLLPNTVRAICCSINYPKSSSLSHPLAAFAQLQDYPTYIRQLLKKYAEKISARINLPQKMRVFSGNAPILEKALAAKAGIGWYGKNSILINQNSGSHFFLGEIFTNLPLPIDKPLANSCGNCTKCIDQCPTKAIVSPYKLDARNCIAYLTIEYTAIIPLHLRPLIGTRVFGCDMCQHACPWNRFAKTESNILFTPFAHFVSGDLAKWFLWDEKEFLDKTKDSPICRIGYERWLRNLAVALGNSPPTEENRMALQLRLNYPSSLVQEHVAWALEHSTTVIFPVL
ncbi:epoxyqueuosine reductase [Gammaproteobacteria bacterium]